MPDPTPPPPAPSSPHDPAEGLAQRLIDQVAQLQARIDRADRRRRIERALADAHAVDIAAAADELETGDAGDGDLAAMVRRLKRDKPGFFGAQSAPSAASLPAPSPPSPDYALAALRDRARTGDRASLLLYLRARRSKQ